MKYRTVGRKICFDFVRTLLKVLNSSMVETSILVLNRKYLIRKRIFLDFALFYSIYGA